MEETKALPLEAGKYYRTRDGRKALMLHRLDVSSGSLPYIGVIGIEIHRWHTDGGNVREAYAGYMDGSHPQDLVAEWVEPKRIKGRMYIGRNGVGVFGSYISETATSPQFCDVVACIDIDVLEGQGLEGGR